MATTNPTPATYATLDRLLDSLAEAQELLEKTPTHVAAAWPSQAWLPNPKRRDAQSKLDALEAELDELLAANPMIQI